MIPLHKSPILEVIIHLGLKEKTSGAAGRENLSEYIYNNFASVLSDRFF